MKSVPKNIFFNLIKGKIKQFLYGKVLFQDLAVILHRVSLRMMNYGFFDVTNNGEINVLRLIKERHIGTIPTIFDVGANIGQYATLIDSVFHGKARVYSFEPGNFTYKKLSQVVVNLKNVNAYNFGFGSEKEELYLNYDKEGSGLASIYKRRLDHLGGSMGEKELVQIKKIDDFCFDNNIEKIDLLKIDVEGHEFEVLLGAKEMIARNKIQAIQFEFGGTNIDSRTFFQDFYYLLKDKYRIYRILRNGLYEINKYSELNEIFTSINYFADHK